MSSENNPARHLILLSIIICILSASAYSYTLEEIMDAGELDIIFSVNTKANIDYENKGSVVRSLTVNLSYFPKEDKTQTIDYINTVPDSDADEHYIIYEIENPYSEEIDISLESELTSRNYRPKIKETINFPLTGLEKDIEAYTQATENINSDNRLIVRQASEIVKGETDLYKAVVSLAEWTENNIEYSLSTLTAQSTQKSSWVLENRYGVCDELSSLFIAMCRSVNIPARFVSGIAYSDQVGEDGGWGPHGWSEVYFPGYGWVPFDVTYRQFGFVDATHIKLKDTIDSTDPSVTFSWKAKDSEITLDPLDFDVQIKSLREQTDPWIDAEVIPSKSGTGFGSYNRFEIKWTNNEDYYVADHFYIGLPGSVEGPHKITVTLKPKETKTTTVIIKADNEFEEGYIYTIPFILILYDRNITASYQIEKRNPVYSKEYFESFSEEHDDEKVILGNTNFKCEPERSDYILGDRIRIECSATNIGNIMLENKKICLEDECEDVSLDIGQTINFEFIRSAEKTGTYNLKASMLKQNENIEYVVHEKPAINISFESDNLEIRQGESTEISFVIDSKNKNTISDVTARLTYNGHEVKSYDITTLPTTINIKIDESYLMHEENTFIITAEFKDLNEEVQNAEKDFTIRIADLNLLGKIKLFIRRLFQ